MNEPGTFAVLMLGLLVGALMTLGLVSVVMFFGSSDTCRAALYGNALNFVDNI